MARSEKTAHEFIQCSFSPVVAVLCSDKVEAVVSKNNLSFTELLQPFASLDSEGQFREPGGSVCLVKNWKLIIRDVNWKPLQPTEARRQLNNAVQNNINDKTISLDLEGRKFDIPQSTPWFDAWREAYLEVQFPSDHEFTKHFLSCIIVGTTQDDNIIDTFNSLNQQYAQLQNVTPHKLPKWFNAGVLKSYLLLHDPSTVLKERADAIFETLKQSFGASNCFMIAINSRTATDSLLPTDYWAPFIKRFESNSEVTSSVTNQMSPLEPMPPSVMGPAISESSEQGISTIQPGSHPLTTNENEVYDQANSLQINSFSGSIESLHVSSRNAEMAVEVHGAALNMTDVETIKRFLQEYASKALLPYLERQISQLSEVVANRKGVSRSLLSATKRWFGSGKGGNTTGNNTVIYTPDCPELQLRRLGDLWFMTGQWQRAFDAYHMAKREFYADSAWLCYAGALEMAAISAFMAGDVNRKMHGYMEESIVTYLNTCRMVQYAVRATLLSALCLNSQGLHGEAAKQLIRMTSEDSDLRSAMLLEQASLCFLSGPGSKAMCRKYAFHMVLAGHRFSKAGQKKHAYRCYQQAYQVYRDSGWRLSTDHVQFAVGRLAGSLRLHAAAERWLGAPLQPAPPAAPPQPPAMQHAFLREYMLHHQQWVENSDEFKECLPVLPLPIVELDATGVLCVGPAPLSSPARTPATSIPFTDKTSTQDEKCWHRMEEMLLQVAQGSVPMIFKPTVDLYTAATDAHPTVHEGEPVQISIILWNPLKISLVLKDVQLLWSFVPGENTEGSKEVLNNEAAVAAGNVLESSAIYGQKIKCVLLEGDAKKTLIFALTPLHVGEINIQGLAYKLINAGEGGNENTNGIQVSGKINLSSVGKKRLQIKVVPPAPCLQMTFSETSPEIISGEIRSVDVEFRNVGPVDMKNLYIAVSHPDCVHLVSDEQDNGTFKALYDDKYHIQPVFSDERAARSSARRRLSSRHVRACGARLAAGAALRARVLLRPRPAARALRLLAYYEPALPAPPAAHRLLRHVFRFNVTDAVEISVTPRRNIKNTNEGMIENMNLIVEAKNVFKDNSSNRTVEVLEVGLLSRQWQLTDLTTAKSIHDPLASNEKLHLVLKSRRLSNISKDPLPEGKVNCSYLKISEGHPDSSANINSSPYCDFVLDDKECYVEKTDSVFEDYDNMNNKSTGLIQSMFVVRWKVKNNADDSGAIGQHCLWMDCFTKATVKEEPNLPAIINDFESRLDLTDKKKKQDNIVLFKMTHPNQITHNFKEKRLCLVPISMNIINCYDVPVEVSIDLSKQQNRSGLNSLGWAGGLGEGGNVKVVLERFESRRLTARGVCAAPGTYELCAGPLTCRPTTDSRPTTLHHATNTSLLIVQQS